MNQLRQLEEILESLKLADEERDEQRRNNDRVWRQNYEEEQRKWQVEQADRQAKFFLQTSVMNVSTWALFALIVVLVAKSR